MSEIQKLRLKHNERCDFPMKFCSDPTMGWLHCICPTAGVESCGWCNRESLNLLKELQKEKDYLTKQNKVMNNIDRLHFFKRNERRKRRRNTRK